MSNLTVRSARKQPIIPTAGEVIRKVGRNSERLIPAPKSWTKDGERLTPFDLVQGQDFKTVIYDDYLAAGVITAINEISDTETGRGHLFAVFFDGIFEVVRCDGDIDGHELIASEFGSSATSLDKAQFTALVDKLLGASPRKARKEFFKTSNVFCLLGAERPGVDDALEIWNASTAEKAFIAARVASPTKSFVVLGTIEVLKAAWHCFLAADADPGTGEVRDLRKGASA